MHRAVPQGLSTESWAARPWRGRVLATLLHSVVWAAWPVALSALSLLQAALPPPGSSHSTRSLTLELGRTGPARRLPQRQPRPGAVQPPQFLQSRRPNPQPTPHHSLALDPGGTQHRKGHDLGLLLGKPQPPTQAAHKPHLLLHSPHLRACTQDNGACMDLGLRASNPTSGGQTPPLPGQPLSWSRGEASPHTLHRLLGTNHCFPCHLGDSSQRKER